MILRVNFVTFPKAKEDALPLVGKPTEDGLVSFSFGFLLLIVGFCPNRSVDGLSGPFDKALSPEFVAAIATVNVAHFGALFGNGCDSAHFLNGGRAFKGGVISSEKGEEPSGECGAGTWEAFEDRSVAMFGCRFFNEFVEALDAGSQSL